MAGTIRVLLAAPEEHVRGVASHVRSLQAGGRTVLYVTADRPYKTLREAFSGEGIDADAVFFVDAVTCMDGNRVVERPSNALFLQSPTMLEMMAMRVEQMISRIGARPHVVVDSLSTLALYNGVPPVQEFSHYLANRLRSHDIPGDFVVRDNQMGNDLRERILGFTDAQVRLNGGIA